MNELRLAARDFVTDPGTQSIQVGEAAAALSEVLKKTRLELAPEQQDMIDGVTERLATYRSGIERISSLINRRAEMIVGVAAVARTIRRRRSPTAPDPVDRLDACSRPRAGSPRRCWRTIPSAAEQAAQSMRSLTIADPKLRAAVDDYAEAIIAHIDPRTADRRYRQGGAGHRGPPDPARDRIVARGQRAPRPRAVPRFRPDAGRGEMAEHRARHRRRPDRAVRGAVGGSPHRASAGVDRDLDPRGGRRREEHLDPRDRRRQRDRRHRPRRRSVPAARWSTPTRRARRRCTRWPSSGSPRKAIASCSKASVDGIYVTTPGGALLNANPALARMMGYDTPQDLISGIGDIADTIYVHPEARAEYRAADAARRHGARVRIPGSRARRRGALALRQRQRRAQRGRRDHPLRGNGARHHRPEARRGCDRRRPAAAAAW